MTEKIGLFYASTTGNTEQVAGQIADAIGRDRVDMHDVATEGIVGMHNYRLLILGIPTWDFGELQEDWQEFWDQLSGLDFSSCRVALFGLGDQIGYGEWFLDAMGLLAQVVTAGGATLIGEWPVEGYEFDASKALTDDGTHFVGLALDEDGQPAETAPRIAQWVERILPVFDA